MTDSYLGRILCEKKVRNEECGMISDRELENTHSGDHYGVSVSNPVCLGFHDLIGKKGDLPGG